MECPTKLEGAMELIIEEGKVLSSIKNYPEVQDWVQDWLSDKSNFVFETSGTSGNKTTLVFSRQQLMASAERTCATFQLNKGTKVLHRLPMQFVAGKMNIIRALVSNHSVWAEKPSMHFDSDWNAQKNQWDWWPTTPAMLTAFIEANGDTNFFKKILLGGGKVQPELIGLLTNFNGECYESYGATETLTHIAIRSIKPFNSGFRWLSGVHVNVKTDGLIVVDDVTKINTFLSDVIHMTSEDTFEVLGRADDVINSGGLKIFPLQVEEILADWLPFPYYISYLPDAKWGNVVALVIEDKQDVSFDHFDWNKIFDGHPIWKPRRVIKVPKIEINANGKIVRKHNPEGLVDCL